MSDKTKTKTRKQPRKAYTDQFKRDAVKLLSQPGYTLAKASEALGVSQASCNPPIKLTHSKVEALT